MHLSVSLSGFTQHYRISIGTKSLDKEFDALVTYFQTYKGSLVLYYFPTIASRQYLNLKLHQFQISPVI